MKNLFAISLVLIALLTSCDMQKRQYRSGWYIGKGNSNALLHDRSSTSAERTFAEAEPDPATNFRSTVDTTPVAAPVNPAEKAFAPYHKAKAKLEELKAQKNDPKMTYAEARKSIADKGARPQPLAELTYYLAWAGILTSWCGLGLILVLVALLISVFATNKTVKDNVCVDENLAIIDRGKRLILLALIWGTIIFLICLGVFLLITSMAVSAAGI